MPQTSKQVAAKEMEKAAQPIETSNGVKVGGFTKPDEYVIFTPRGWDFPRRYTWQSGGDIESILMMLDWIVDWNLYSSINESQDADLPEGISSEPPLLPFEPEKFKEDPSTLRLTGETYKHLIMCCSRMFGWSGKLPKA